MQIYQNETQLKHILRKAAYILSLQVEVKTKTRFIAIVNECGGDCRPGEFM